jgi:hypothetical protein
MKVQKWFILILRLLVIVIYWLKEPLRAWFAQLAIYRNPALSIGAFFLADFFKRTNYEK